MEDVEATIVDNRDIATDVEAKVDYAWRDEEDALMDKDRKKPKLVEPPVGKEDSPRHGCTGAIVQMFFNLIPGIGNS